VESHWAALARIGRANSGAPGKEKSLVDTIKNLSERELLVAFSALGIISGVLFAGILQPPLVGHPISIAIFRFFALSRNTIEKVLPSRLSTIRFGSKAASQHHIR
jgi:hypothetical protein